MCSRYLLSGVLFFASLFFSPQLALADQNQCGSFLNSSITHEMAEQRVSQSPETVESQAYVLYNNLKSYASFKDLFSEDQVLDALFNDISPYYRHVLNEIFDKIQSPSVQHSKASIIKVLKTSLQDQVPQSSILSRIESFETKKAGSLKRVLGEMAISEVQELTYGTDPLAPSGDSLIGKYIQETGAQTVVRAFAKDPVANVVGPNRLVVAVSATSFDAFSRFFGKTNYLMHVHTPNQGTLLVSFNKKAGSYANLNTELRAPAIGTIIPLILLSSSEGNRAINFFALGALPVVSAQHPWTLQGTNEKGEPESYCAMSGYNSCTHWFGNLPVGDELVQNYSFPGKVDQYAANAVGIEPQTKKLSPFIPINPLEKFVWTVPGHQQLADVLDLKEQNLAGEFASPGYVAMSLTGRAPIGRVPVVFLLVQDHRAPIAPDFPTQIHAY